MVDLPEPTRPMSATRSPAAILKLMPSMAESWRFGYAKRTLRNSMSPRSCGRWMKVAPLGRSTGLSMMRLSESSAVRAPWYCMSSPTICPAGASARPDSMVEATRAPIVSSFCPMRYTPTRITATDTPCVSVAVLYMADDDSARIFTLVRARNALARSHFACTTLSAPCALMVSMAPRLSTSVALRIALAL